MIRHMNAGDFVSMGISKPYEWIGESPFDFGDGDTGDDGLRAVGGGCPTLRASLAARRLAAATGSGRHRAAAGPRSLPLAAPTRETAATPRCSPRRRAG